MEPRGQGAPGALAGHVESTDGARVPGAVVTVLGGDGRAVAAVVADGTGCFTAGGLHPGVWWVVVQADGHRPVLDRVASVEGEQRHLALRCTPTSVVHGLVRDGPIGRPLGGLTVRLVGPGRPTARTTVSGPSGAYEFAGVDAGAHTVEVVGTDGHVVRRDVTVTPGAEVRADVDVVPLAALTVAVSTSVLGPVDEPRISVVDRHGRVVRSGALGADGRACYRGLQPGDYLVVVGHAAPVRVALPAEGAEVRVSLSAPTAVGAVRAG